MSITACTLLRAPVCDFYMRMLVFGVVFITCFKSKQLNLNIFLFRTHIGKLLYHLQNIYSNDKKSV